MITQEIRALLFAPFLGQKLEYRKQELNDYLLAQILVGNLTGEKLILRPLSNIADEDAIEVDKIICRDYLHIKGFHTSVRGRVWINDIFYKQFPVSRSYLVYQYLQSKGYDLPHYLLGGKTFFESELAVYE